MKIKIMLFLMVLLLCACSTSTVVNDNGTVSVKEKDVTITRTVASLGETEEFVCDDFSITIPKGWQVSYGGVYMFKAIRVYDPENPVNQMFYMLKAQPFLHSEEGKAAWEYNYNLNKNSAMASAAWYLANSPVLYNPSTEGFYQTWPLFVDLVKDDIDFQGFEFPRFEQFSVTETMPSVSPLSNYAIADELLRATFTQSGKTGEGLFAASVVDFGEVQIGDGTINGYTLGTADGGYYMVYNIMAISAEKDTLIEWEPLLIKCMSSLEYSESFVKATIANGEEQVNQALEFSKTANEISNGIMDSWEKRNTSQDIISQKQSDATLGYERVYDKETGEIYRADNGWYDTYKNEGERYELVTDDGMYTEAISGYIK
ncbi:MAG: hypothetical protein ACI4WM_09185 [Erysipelotrichaceae bacterium]